MKFNWKLRQQKQKIRGQEARIDFSFKREVFFIVVAGFVGALVMAIPMTFFSPGRSYGYDLTWIVFGNIVGVSHPLSSTIIAGVTIHIITGISIGILSGIFLYKTNILNISKPSNGFYYGLFTGTLVYLIFAIPVEQFVLNPEYKVTLSGVTSNSGARIQGPDNNNSITFSTIQLYSIAFSILINLLFGITLGLFSSLLTIKFGARYRCPQDCDISFSRKNVFGHSQKGILTFVIVGGGFAGVETAGELNDFIRDSIKYYYHNIDKSKIRVVIVQSGNRLLPEMSEELAQFALEKLHKSGVEVILNSRVTGATEHSVKLKDGNIIPTKTIIWSGGVAPSSLVQSLSCMHDNKSGRIIVDKYLEILEYKGVYALGDCTFIIDPNTGNPYPPTAQHAIREGAVVAQNIIAYIEEKMDKKEVFDYKTKGLMASIGKHTGVGNLMGIQVQGFLAWWIWRNYYLANLPTLHKKIRVLVDWIIDIFFRRDVTMLKTLAEIKRE